MKIYYIDINSIFINFNIKDLIYSDIDKNKRKK